MRKIGTIWLCFMFVFSTASVFVSANNGAINSNDSQQSKIDSPPEIEYFWDNTTSASYKYHLATKNDIEKMKESIGVYDLNKNYNQIVEGHGTGLAPPTLEEWNNMVGNLHVVDEISPSKSDPLPTTMDLSLDPCFPIVDTQGGQNSCAAWAMTYYSYGYLEAKDNGWNEASLGNQSQLMNPGWTYNKVNSGSDTGSSAFNNGKILRDWGCPSWSTMPYDDSDYTSWGDENAFREAPLHRASGVYYLTYDHDTIISDLKTLVDAGTPVTFRMSTSEYTSGLADNYVISSFEYDCPVCNHLNTIVGYDDGITEDGDVGAFRIVNSWGDSFSWPLGDDGYYWLTYDALIEIGDLGELTPVYITDKPNYSPSLTAVWEFSTNGTRDTDITLGVGNYGSPLDTILPYYREVTQYFPTFMSIDITEFEDEYNAGTNDFFLEIGDGIISATISDFWVEYYNWTNGNTLFSPPSLDTPEVTPGYVTVSGVFGKYPEVTINVYAINEIDDIDGITGAEWYYYTCLYDGEYTWTPMQGPWSDQNFVIVDREHDYRATSTIVNPIIMLCEEDLVWDDYADVSSDDAGGVDDVDHPITPPDGTWYLGSYRGIYDLRDDTLSGDIVISDSGYWLTSGNFDGRPGDENDAEIWFDIWDNYELPVASAGPNQNINTSITSNNVSFDGSSSTASDGSTIVSYDWDFGDGNSSSGISPTHEYPIDGVYVVSLTVTDNLGESDINTCIITVDGSKVHNYGRGKSYFKIQYALDDAESHNWAGDTINVEPGTFDESIDINIPVDLIGSGVDVTYINGGDNDTIDVWSEFVNISGFNITGNSNGIELGRDDCNIFNNSISTQVGIEIYRGANTTLLNNSMFGCSIFLNSGLLEDYNNLIILSSNTVNGRPVYYYKDVVGVLIPPDAGEVILINCTDMEISNQHFFNATLGYEVVFSSNITVNNTNSSFNSIGGAIVMSFNCTVSNSIMSNNTAVGFYLVFYSHNNTISSNSFVNNENGMTIYDSVDNLIYHNSFINNNNHSYDEGSNSWDNGYPDGGNFWSDYTGIDTMFGPGQDQTGPDGIGDSPYNNTYGQGIQGGSTEDNYPLMSPGDYEDTILPTSQVDVITPYWYNTSPLTITATASDTRSPVVSVQLWYSFEGAAYQLFETDNLAPWEWNFNWPDGDGNYTFYSIAEDSNANIEPIPATEDEVAGYDITDPISAVNPMVPYWLDSLPLTINAIANDGISAVASVELFTRYSVDNITWNNWASFSLDSLSPWSWNFDFPNGDGYYEFYTIATDNTGNVEGVPSTADTICAYDSESPEIVDNSLVSATTSEIFTVTVTVEDCINVTSVHVVYWFGNDTATNTTAILVSTNTYELAIHIPSNSTLSLYYKITATDHLGKWNSTTVKTVTIVDNDAPTANAGSDQTAVEDTIVIFDGSGSADNIGIINYTWSFSISRAIITLYGPNPQHNFTVPGNYSVTLTVSDATGNIDNDTLMITVQLDTDGDGIPDDTDVDDDNDGTPDVNDDFPTDPDEDTDTDGDGIGNNADTDDDGDGVSDDVDKFPLDQNETTDNDGDGIGDSADEDDDNDGIPDVEDPYPFDPTKPSTGMIWWVFLILVIIIALMGSYILFSRKNNKRDQ